MALVTLSLGACIVRLVNLQLVDGVRNRQLAEENRIRPVPLPASRGNILDRQGRLLAANRLTRSVYLWPREQSETRWRTTAVTLGKILKLPPDEIIKKLKDAGFKTATPVRIANELSQETFVALEEAYAQLPGIEIRGEANRFYPNGNLASHVLGYISEATLEDLRANPSWPMGIIVGRMGIERITDLSLQGTWGSHLIEMDAQGQPLRVLGDKPPIGGESVQLTLDVDLQKTAERALAQRRGAVVVLDIKTGAVLAMASGPSFDPNIFTRRMSQAEWDRLQRADNPFLNRALQGYPPASTFKIVSATAAMESGKYTPDSLIATSAYVSVGGFQFHEHGGGYGLIGFRDALAVSSNTFFYRVGLTVGPEQLAKWAKRLGVGTTPTMNLDGASHGMVPTPAEKKKLFNEPWYAGDTVTSAIGQGLVQVTPLESAVIISTIANGGKRVIPHLLASQTNTALTRPQETGVKASTINTIRSGLVAVVQEGTGRSLNDGSIPLTAGKTGTAEVVGRPNNSLWVGYGPVDHPKVAIAVMIESGGYGATAAVPVAHEVYKTYFQKTKK
jgi:penicillin-binding protein 2